MSLMSFQPTHTPIRFGSLNPLRILSNAQEEANRRYLEALMIMPDQTPQDIPAEPDFPGKSIVRSWLA